MKKFAKGILIGTAVVVLGTTAVFAAGAGTGTGSGTGSGAVLGYNEDGRALVQDLHIKYMDYTDALEPLMEDQNMEVYLADNADVVLTVAGDNAAKSSEILDNVESCMSQHQNVYCHSGNSEEVHHAHDAGLSFGKYQAWQVLQLAGPSGSGS